jgi:hypothetical protein
MFRSLAIHFVILLSVLGCEQKNSAGTSQIDTNKIQNFSCAWEAHRVNDEEFTPWKSPMDEVLKVQVTESALSYGNHTYNKIETQTKNGSQVHIYQQKDEMGTSTVLFIETKPKPMLQNQTVVNSGGKSTFAGYCDQI